MIKSLRHLRATTAEWAANDIVIPDGEIALERTDSGVTKVKIGNGESAFSALPSLLGDSYEAKENTVRLASGAKYRCGSKNELILILPNTVDYDFYCEVSFDSPTDATELSIGGASVRLTGDECADGELLPEASMHYTIFIWYDGEYQGVVRGIRNAS